MIVLVRVDERLIHGQVVVGWRGALDPTLFVVIDDGVAATDWERDLVLAGVPDGTRGEVHTVAQTATLWQRWLNDSERRLLLVRGVQTLVAMIDAGIALRDVNVGGLHQGPGRREVLAYMYCSDEEIALFRRLCSAGVRLRARDVPGASTVDLCQRLLSRE